MNPKYKTRIANVIRYIEQNLNKKISLQEVAKVSCFSEFHFHRIFTGFIGETVNDYIARRRLEQAVNMLVFYPDKSITQVALECGFSSGANFAKAVKNYFGFSPSQIRDPSKVKNSKIGKVLSKYGKAFDPNQLYPHNMLDNSIQEIGLKGVDMKIEVKTLECLPVCILASSGGYEPTSLFATWDKLSEWAIAHGISANQQQRFAFCYDNPAVTPIDKCRYEAAVVISGDIAVNEPFGLSEIPAGQYAVCYFKGAPEQTIQAQLSIYSQWLPNSGFEPDALPMLEHYLNDVRNDGYVEMEIYVKLKSLSSAY